MRTHPRTRTLAVLLAVLMAAFTFTSVTVAGPAAAGPIDDPIAPGSPGGAPGGGTQQQLSCDGSRLTEGPRIIYNWTSSCNGGNFTGHLLGNNFSMCNTGMAVFRFYGTVADPVAGYSVSRATPQSPNCTAGHVDWYRLYRNVPTDATPAGMNLAPLLSSWPTTATATSTPNSRTLTTDAGLLGGIHNVWQASGTVPAGNNSGYWGTIADERTEKVGGGCSTIAHSNYWADYYQSVLTSNDAVYTPENRAARLRAIRLNIYNAAKSQEATLNVTNAGERHTIAMQTVGVQTSYIRANPAWGVPKAIPGHDLRPVWRNGVVVDVVGTVQNPENVNRDLPNYAVGSESDRFAEVFSTNPCYSEANFYNQLSADEIMSAQPLTGDARANFAVRGICYIPLYNAARLDEDGTPSLGAASSYYRLGERFGDNYSGTLGTAGRENLTSLGAAVLTKYAGNGAAAAVLNTYRLKMSDWYTGKAINNAGTTDWGPKAATAVFNGDPDAGALQTLPAQPYDYSKPIFATDGGQSINAVAARDTLRDKARCELEPITVAPTHNDASPPSEPVFSFATHLNIDAPGFMRAGGNMWAKNIITVKAATGNGLINGVSCVVSSTGGTLKAGDRCPAGTYGDSVSIKPTKQGGADNSIFATSAPGFASSEWWSAPQDGAPCLGLACVNPRFARASVDSSQTFNAAINPADVTTNVSYSFDSITAPGFKLYDWNNGLLVEIPPVITRKTETATYAGLTNDASRPGSLTVTNPKAPSVAPSAPGGIKLSYKVWGSVNSGGGISGGQEGDGSTTMPGGEAGGQ